VHHETYVGTFEQRDWDETPEGTVRMAVVGLGGFARGQALPALAEATYATPAVAVSGSPSAAAAVGDEYGTTHLSYEEYAAGEATDEYDAVYVATPNATHLGHVETAAGLGKDVICEKPLEVTPDRARRVVDACESADVRLMTAYRMQADPVVRRLREFLRSGGVGDPLEVGGGYAYPTLEFGDVDQWRLDPDLAGGGAMVDVGIYPLNTARFLLDAEPKAVSAETRGEGPFAGVDGHAAATYTFDDGVFGSFTASFEGQYDSRLWVRGTDGRVELAPAFAPAGDRTVRIERDGASVTVEPPGVNEVTEEFDYFAHALLAGGEVEPDGADGLADVRALAATYEAADGGRRVRI
jgi:xylose dehydrogenase (NAD/NADP)